MAATWLRFTFLPYVAAAPVVATVWRLRMYIPSTSLRVSGTQPASALVGNTVAIWAACLSQHVYFFTGMYI